jgi:hypothetical protein
MALALPCLTRTDCGTLGTVHITPPLPFFVTYVPESTFLFNNMRR